MAKSSWACRQNENETCIFEKLFETCSHGVCVEKGMHHLVIFPVWSVRVCWKDFFLNDTIVADHCGALTQAKF